MPWNSTLVSALRFIDVKPTSSLSAGSATISSPIRTGDMSAIWMERFYYVYGELAACGMSVGVATATPGRYLMAGLEARFTSADWVIHADATAGREVAPQGRHLLSAASAMLTRYCDNPAAISALSGGVFDTSFRLVTDGYFQDDPSDLTDIDAQNDVVFTREIEQ